jgi:hypothetical protein
MIYPGKDALTEAEGHAREGFVADTARLPAAGRLGHGTRQAIHARPLHGNAPRHAPKSVPKPA